MPPSQPFSKQHRSDSQPLRQDRQRSPHLPWNGFGTLAHAFHAFVCLFLLVFANLAHAQYPDVVPFTGAGSATSTESGAKNYVATLGDTPPGRLWNGSYTLTNTTLNALRFTNPKVTRSPTTGLTLVSHSAPTDVTLNPGESLVIPFQAGVPSTGTIAKNASVTIRYDVIWVYDKVWRDDDFFNASPAPSQAELFASKDDRFDFNVKGAIPGTAYQKKAIFTNDLKTPVTISYKGYKMTGTIEPYISGTLCGSVPNSTKACLNAPDRWTGDITLQPGESSHEFSMLLGMPWQIGNESQSKTGTLEFEWKISSKSASMSPIPVPALGPWALVLLAMCLGGLGLCRTKEKRC